ASAFRSMSISRYVRPASAMTRLARRQSPHHAVEKTITSPLVDALAFAVATRFRQSDIVGRDLRVEYSTKQHFRLRPPRSSQESVLRAVACGHHAKSVPPASDRTSNHVWTAQTLRTDSRLRLRKGTSVPSLLPSAISTRS